MERNALRVSCRKKKELRNLNLDTTPLVMHPMPLVRQMLDGRPSWKERGFPNASRKKKSQESLKGREKIKKKNPNNSQTSLSPRKG